MGLLATSYINPGKCVNTNMMRFCRNIFYPYDLDGNGSVPFSDLCWAKKCGEGLLTDYETSNNLILQSTDVQNVGTNYRYLNGKISNLFSFYYFLQHSLPGADSYTITATDVRRALNNIGSAPYIYCGLQTKIQSPWFSNTIPDWGNSVMEDYSTDPSDEYYWDPYDVIDNDCTFGFWLDVISLSARRIGLSFDAPNGYPVPEHWTDAGYRIYFLFIAYPECVKKLRVMNNVGIGWGQSVEFEGYQYDGFSYYVFEWTGTDQGDSNTGSTYRDILRSCGVTAMYIEPALQISSFTISGWVS